MYAYRSLACTAAIAAVAFFAPAAIAEQAIQAGVSAAVRGEVALTSSATRQTRRPDSGEDVFLGDAVTTGAESGMQLLLLDESVFTIGEGAELVIDRYVYDPDRGTAELSASLLRGGMRFVSGGISRTQPENVELKLPAATIGVRGTIVSTLQTPEGAYVFLDGPARDNSALQREGLAEVSAGGQTVVLSRSGFATFVPNGGFPQPPFRPDPQIRAQILNAVSVGSGQSGSGDAGGGQADEPQTGQAEGQGGQTESPSIGRPADAAGATRVAALETASVRQALTSTQTSSENLDPDAGERAPGTSASNAVPTLASIATIAELDSIASGVGHFSGSGLFFQTAQAGTTLSSAVVGTMRMSMQIDFGNRTVFGANSGIRITAGSIDYFESLSPDSFDDVTGTRAVFADDGNSGSPVTGTFTIYNTPDRTAGYGIAVVGYDDGSGNVGNGSAGAARADGPAPGAN